MADVGLRDLRQNASEFVRRVEAGESFTVTVSGRPAARLVPAGGRTWRRFEEIADILAVGAPGLAAESERFDDELTDPYSR